VVTAVLIVAFVVFVNESVRQIPVNYARKGGRFGPNSSYIPLRLNQAGVVPIIFAVSLVLLPSLVGQFLVGVKDPRISSFASDILLTFSPSSFWYNVIYFLLVVGLTFFYTSFVFNPVKISEDLQKLGGFIPGIRPGTATQRYLKETLNKVTAVGAVFLGLVAILPSFFQNVIGVSNLAIGGTGVLIVVSVVLETVKSLESQLVMGRYERFLK
jgi:preprotein translocase subunit SecY